MRHRQGQLQWADTERSERKAGTLFMLMLLVPVVMAIVVLGGYVWIVWS